MKKITMSFTNCYGIKKLEQEFNFEYENRNGEVQNSKVISIYAANGTMKTSLSKTFYQLSKGEEPKDEIHGKPTLCHIMINDEVVKPAEIFVVKSAIDYSTESEHVSTLLVDSVKKREYDAINDKIIKLKSSLIIKLNKFSGVKKEDIEKRIIEDFASDDFFKCISNIKVERFKDDFSDIKYSDVFEKDVLDVLKNPAIRQNIDNYIQQYNSILEESGFLEKGKFNLTHADKVVKTLSEEGFFVSKNAVLLTGEEMPLYEKELKIKMDETQKRINTNPELKKIRELLTGKAKCKKFEEILESMDDISGFLNEIKDLDAFKKKLWVSYFKKEPMFGAVIAEYKANVSRLNGIEEQAEFENTKWKEAIDKFNDRFKIKYTLDIDNKKSAIVGKQTPNVVIKTIDEDSGLERSFDRKELSELDVLSQGERRALYLLNIIFEVEARKASRQKTLFIVDDIADSFDYKNKYAIIQYLREIAEIDIFYLIILTHNFDFFRTIESRFVKYRDCYIAVKNNGGIRLEKATGIKNPFILDWKKNLNDRKKLIASIPFVRNIIEYTQGSDGDEYQDLTSLLHYMPGVTELIGMERLSVIFPNAIPNIIFPVFDEATPCIFQMIQDEAMRCLTADEGINLENKIVLSIALRNKAEKYMIDSIADEEFIRNLLNECREKNKAQTYPIYKKYVSLFPEDKEHRELIDEINLTTPENIHVNSFMFEPIIDISDSHLRDIYRRALDLF